jgi:tol-pal system protein YbgF
MVAARLFFAGVSLILLMVGAAPAFADDRDVRALQDRLDRVERDLNQVQRQVYHNATSGGTAPLPSGGDAPSGNALLDIQVRMDRIEEQMRNLTGRVEEVQFGISQVTTKVDKIQQDNEVRFQQIESAAAAAPPPTAAVGAIRPAARVPPSAGNMDVPVSTGGLLVAPPGARESSAGVPAAPPVGRVVPVAPSSGSSAANLPAGTAQEQYTYAFGLLRDSDYKAAELAFKGFLAQHPQDPLAGNAEYWLGESYFVRSDYPAAAAVFAEGYKKYPQGPKAADTLLKLGMALDNAGRKSDACTAYGRLERDFPNLQASVRQSAAREKKRLDC